MARACVFCGFEGKLTAEHVFGDWLNALGLGNGPSRGGAGLLNRSLRDLGVARPFGRTVRTVCAPCNNGWMSKLEAVAARVLSPIILAKASAIDVNDAAALTAWAQKTALVSMCMLDRSERAANGGLPVEEFRALYARRDSLEPLPDTQLWLARYRGRQRLAAAYVTPMAVRLPGVREPDRPQAYVATILLGEVLLQCVRFTTPALAFGLANDLPTAPVWPVAGRIEQPGGSIDDEAFVRVAKGLNLRPNGLPVAFRPWTPATDLPPSDIVGSFVELPTPCCDGYLYYPTALVEEALRGVFYAFVAACDCGMWHLVVTESDGAHFKAEAPSLTEELVMAFERRAGTDVLFENGEERFVCRRLVS